MAKNNNAPNFGGNWTKEKLAILKGYLRNYSKALQKQPFEKIYIDAFSGTGTISVASKKVDNKEQNFLFPNMIDTKIENFFAGSTRLALSTIPPFDKYIFIEKNANYCQELEKLKEDFPELSPKIFIYREDANTKLQHLCDSIPWKQRGFKENRAVVFIDPYGMELEWKTLEKIAETKAIDLWLLHPLSMGVNRLLRKGDIPESWKRKIRGHTGKANPIEIFYRKFLSDDLFGSYELKAKKRLGDIGRDYVNELKKIFTEVKNPVVLRNSLNSPIYLLIFAVSSDSDRAISLALRLAEYWLGNHERFE